MKDRLFTKSFAGWLAVGVAYAILAWHGMNYLYATETAAWNAQTDQCRADGGRVVENYFGPVVGVCRFDK